MCVSALVEGDGVSDLPGMVGNGLGQALVETESSPIVMATPPSTTSAKSTLIPSLVTNATMDHQLTNMSSGISNFNQDDSQNSFDSQSSTPNASNKRPAEDSPGKSNSNKKSRGPKQYQCELCDAHFVYLTSFQKHCWKHQKELKAQGKSLSILGSIMPVNNSPVAGYEGNMSVNNSKVMGYQEKLASMAQAPYHMQATHEEMEPQISIKQEIHEIEISPKDLKIEPINIQPLTSPSISATPPDVSALASQMQVSPPYSQPGMYTRRSQEVQNPVPHITSPIIEAQKPTDNDNTVTMSMEDDPNCWICSRNFTYRTSFIKHMRTEHQITVIMEDQKVSKKTGHSFQCELCHCKFFYIAAYHKHMYQNHGIAMEGEDCADLVGKVDTNLPALDLFSNLQKAIANSSALNHYPGNEDGQNLILQTKENGEYVIIDNQLNEIILGESLVCSVCLKSFMYKQSFLKHMDQAHGIKVTDETDSSIVTDSKPKHDSSKTGKLFYCRVCYKKFDYKLPFEKHMEQAHNIAMVVMEKISAEETFYSCPVCSQLYQTDDILSAHMTNRHQVELVLEDDDGGVKPPNVFQCSDCSSKFNSLDSLDAHLAEKHGKRIESEEEEDIEEEDMYAGAAGVYAEGPDQEEEDGEIDPGQIGETDIFDSDEEGVIQKDNNDDEEALEVPEIPERVLSPGGRSMIKCRLCDKTFKFNIAYQKHKRMVHNSEPTVSNEDLELTQEGSTEDNIETIGGSTDNADATETADGIDQTTVNDFNENLERTVSSDDGEEWRKLAENGASAEVMSDNDDNEEESCVKSEAPRENGDMSETTKKSFEENVANEIENQS